MDASKIQKMNELRSAVVAAEAEAFRLMLAGRQAQEDGNTALYAELKPRIKAARQTVEAALDASTRFMNANGM